MCHCQQGVIPQVSPTTCVTVAIATHLAFATRYAQVVGAAVEAKQCLQEALDAHNATLWWWQRKVRLVDESTVRKVA
jgi:hypothetical protein